MFKIMGFTGMYYRQILVIKNVSFIIHHVVYYISDQHSVDTLAGICFTIFPKHNTKITFFSYCCTILLLSVVKIE